MTSSKEATFACAADETVVLLAIAGDDLAFKELVRRRQSWLRTVLRRLTGDPTLADDLCQEAFTKAWRNIGAVQDHRAFVPWLRQIAVRVWMDWARARKNDFEIDDPDASASPRAAGGVETADHRLDLQSALAKLGPGPRTCVILFYAEGMSHSEIASITGLKLGVVKSHIARSTRRLRNDLKEWVEHD